MNFLNTKAAGYAVLGVVAIGGIYWLSKRAASGVSSAIGSVGDSISSGASTLGSSFLNSDPRDPYNLNGDSVYAGFGPIGSLANVTNKLSGGTLESLGDWLGGNLYDLMHPGDGTPVATPTTQYQPARAALAPDRTRTYGDNFLNTLPPGL